MNACLRAAVSCGSRIGTHALFVAALLLTPTLPAQNLVRIEEDWELVIATPDANSAGPQIACTMSPHNNISNTHFTLEINHRSLPYWSPGGITLHQWNGEWRVQSMDRPDRFVMQTPSETVTWTQILEVDEGVLTFQIKDGVSTTWGPFGYTNFLKLQTQWSSNNINGYSPAVSVERSGISYAGNRVASLKLLRVRGTLSDGTVATDDTVRVVHELTSQ